MGWSWKFKGHAARAGATETRRTCAQPSWPLPFRRASVHTDLRTHSHNNIRWQKRTGMLPWARKAHVGTLKIYKIEKRCSERKFLISASLTSFHWKLPSQSCKDRDISNFYIKHEILITLWQIVIHEKKLKKKYCLYTCTWQTTVPLSCWRASAQYENAEHKTKVRPFSCVIHSNYNQQMASLAWHANQRHGETAWFCSKF